MLKKLNRQPFTNNLRLKLLLLLGLCALLFAGSVWMVVVNSIPAAPTYQGSKS